jgi:hypothetical protein
MDIKAETDAKGTTEISVDQGLNPDGSKAETRWTIPASQAAQHLPMFTGEAAPVKISAGEASAMADAANEYAKQLKS